MFRMRLEVNQELLDRLRQLPDRAQRSIRRKIVTELGPTLEADANELMSEGPGLPSSPFQFGTENSRLFYLIMVHQDPTLTDGAHWLRNGDIEGAFVVEVSDRFRGVMFRIVNKNNKAKYVLGPWTVQGHINTGWPEKAEQVRQILRDKARREIARMWREACRAALRGED